METKMQVFAAEKEAGLEHQIKTQSSIAYESPILLDEKQDLAQAFDNLSISTAAMDDKDIYHVYSILVTTSWNKNDDVFDKAEVWAAQNTPKYKPANLEHDERQIVGGIVDNWSVDKNMKVIDKHIQSDSLPDYYHILVASVIYRQWQDPAYQTRAENLIKEIEAGNKFVSMECLFAGFDYAVIDKTGSQKLVTRSDDSSFLTKHLRAYGGTGEYEGYKVGRALRDISFSGKGLVSNPANPRSIILNSKSIAFSVDGFSTMKETNMSESQVQEEQLVEEPVVAEELTEEVVETVEADAVTDNSTTEATEVAEEVSETVAEETDDKTAKHYEDDDEKKKKKEDEAKASLEEALKSAEAKIAALEAVVAKSAQDLKQAESEMYDMKKKQKEEKRKAALIEAGVSADELDATLASFGSLDDEAFDAVVNLYARKSVVATNSEEEVVEEAEAEAEATEIFDEVETSEATLVEAETEEVDEIQATRASISEYISKSILSK